MKDITNTPLTQAQLQELAYNIEYSYKLLNAIPCMSIDEMEDQGFYFVSDESSDLWCHIQEMECEFSYYVHTCEDPTILPF